MKNKELFNRDLTEKQEAIFDIALDKAERLWKIYDKLDELNSPLADEVWELCESRIDKVEDMLSYIKNNYQEEFYETCKRKITLW